MNALYLNDFDATIRWTDTGGGGGTVIYLSGLGMQVTPNFLSTLCDRDMPPHRAVLIDYIGAGLSDASDRFDHSLAGHAASVAAVIRYLGLGPCPVVGYSMGGSVGIQLALDAPDLVSALVVAEGNLWPGGGAGSRRIAQQPVDGFIATGFAEMMAMLRSEEARGDAIMSYLAATRATSDPRGLHSDASALVHIAPDFGDRFAALDVPRHFIFGEEAFKAPPGADTPDPEWLTEHGISQAVVPGTGHEMMISNPGGFVAALAPFLKKALT